jgi:hypothetical protein
LKAKEDKALQKEIDRQMKKDIAAKAKADRAAAKVGKKPTKKAANKSNKSHIVILKCRSEILRKLELVHRDSTLDIGVLADIVPATARSGRQIILP